MCLDDVLWFANQKCITYCRLINARSQPALWWKMEQASLWISEWEWVEDRHRSFILSDTPGIPCSHLCHFRFTLAPLTELLINHDNNVFLLFSPHLPVPGQMTFFFWESAGETKAQDHQSVQQKLWIDSLDSAVLFSVLKWDDWNEINQTSCATSF